jgi:carbonic anhydrase
MADFNALLQGYRRFRDSAWRRERERWSELADGQSPKVMLVACSDSRIDPSLIFDAKPGEMFVIRNVANLVPPCELGGGRHGISAAIEFAVTQLQVEEIIVMGHGSCGGCAAALTGQFAEAGPGEGGFVARWIGLLDEARAAVIARHGADGAKALEAMEHEAVKVSLRNLRTFPWVAKRESEGRLKLHGAFFAIADGVLHVLDEEIGRFAPAAGA